VGSVARWPVTAAGDDSAATLLWAKVLFVRWREHTNTIRPLSALGYRPTPLQEWQPLAFAWRAPKQTHEAGLMEGKILTLELASFMGTGQKSGVSPPVSVSKNKYIITYTSPTSVSSRFVPSPPM